MPGNPPSGNRLLQGGVVQVLFQQKQIPFWETVTFDSDRDTVGVANPFQYDHLGRGGQLQLSQIIVIGRFDDALDRACAGNQAILDTHFREADVVADVPAHAGQGYEGTFAALAD